MIREGDGNYLSSSAVQLEYGENEPVIKEINERVRKRERQKREEESLKSSYL